ncbi:hypothetical protein AFFFEF_01021 [Methylorubrum extorquens]
MGQRRPAVVVEIVQHQRQKRAPVGRLIGEARLGDGRGYRAQAREGGVVQLLVQGVADPEHGLLAERVGVHDLPGGTASRTDGNDQLRRVCERHRVLVEPGIERDIDAEAGSHLVKDLPDDPLPVYGGGFERGGGIET